MQYNAFQSLQAFEAGQGQRKAREQETAMKGIGNAFASGDYTGAANQAFGMGDLPTGMSISQYGKGLEDAAAEEKRVGLIKYGMGLLNTPAQQREAMRPQIAASLQQMGIELDPAQLQTMDLSDEGIKATLSTLQDTDSLMAQFQGMMAPTEYGFQNVQGVGLVRTDSRAGSAETVVAGRREPIEINGVLVDPDTYEPIGDYRTPAQTGEMTAYQRQQLANEAARLGLTEAELLWKMETEAASEGSGLNPALAGLPSGVQSAIVTKELGTLDASEANVGQARKAANLARTFMAESEGYGALGGGPLADIGQATSQKTASLKGVTAEMIPMMRQPGEGIMTDADAKRYESAVVSINKGRKANQRVVDDLERFEKNEADRDAFLRAWQQQNGYGSVNQAKQVWMEYANANPIFDAQTGKVNEARPDIMSWLGASQGGATEFDDGASIPEGATVEDENGNRFRKQNGQLVRVMAF